MGVSESEMKGGLVGVATEGVEEDLRGRGVSCNAQGDKETPHSSRSLSSIPVQILGWKKPVQLR